VAFLDGTQPTETCDHSTGNQQNIFQKIFGFGQRPVNPPPSSTPVARGPSQPTKAAPARPAEAQQQANGEEPNQKKKKKRGFWSRLFGRGNDNKKDNNPQ
jgi:penicillin-binding protein 1B